MPNKRDKKLEFEKAKPFKDGFVKQKSSLLFCKTVFVLVSITKVFSINILKFTISRWLFKNRHCY